MDLSQVRVFVELTDVSAVNEYIALGWKCVKIALRSVPHSPAAGEIWHVYILGWSAETPPVVPPAEYDGELDGLF